MSLFRSRLFPLTTVVILSLFLAGNAIAQPPQAPQAPISTVKTRKATKGHQSALQQALASLNLTADQKAKIKPLTDTYRDETKKGATLTPLARREKSKQLLKAINAVLTPEQQAKLKLAMARISGPMASAARELKLTPAQRTKITPIVQKANEDIAKLNADKSLKGKAKRDKTQSIVKTAVASIKANGGLTDAQKTKLDTIAAKIGQRKPSAKKGMTPGAAVPAPK